MAHIGRENTKPPLFASVQFFLIEVRNFTRLIQPWRRLKVTDNVAVRIADLGGRFAVAQRCCQFHTEHDPSHEQFPSRSALFRLRLCLLTLLLPFATFATAPERRLVVL